MGVLEGNEKKKSRPAFEGDLAFFQCRPAVLKNWENSEKGSRARSAMANTRKRGETMPRDWSPATKYKQSPRLLSDLPE